MKTVSAMESDIVGTRGAKPPKEIRVAQRCRALLSLLLFLLLFLRKGLDSSAFGFVRFGPSVWVRPSGFVRVVSSVRVRPLFSPIEQPLTICTTIQHSITLISLPSPGRPQLNTPATLKGVWGFTIHTGA